MARVPGGFGINDVRGVRSRPSRAVSLRDVRDLPVQTMGFDWVYTDYGYETTSPGGTKVRITGPHKGNEAGSRGGKYWSIETDGGTKQMEYEPTLKDAKEVAERDVPRWDKRKEESRVAQEENARKIAQIREERQRQRESRMDLNTSMAEGGQQALPGMEPPSPWAMTPEQIAIGKAGVEESRRRLQHGNPPEPPNHLDNLAQQRTIRDALFAIAAAGGGAAALGGFGGGGMLRGMGSGLGAFR